MTQRMKTTRRRKMSGANPSFHGIHCDPLLHGWVDLGPRTHATCLGPTTGESLKIDSTSQGSHQSRWVWNVGEEKSSQGLGNLLEDIKHDRGSIRAYWHCSNSHPDVFSLRRIIEELKKWMRVPLIYSESQCNFCLFYCCIQTLLTWQSTSL